MTEKGLKEISYYHNLVKAWFATSLIRDCLVSIFSIVCIFVHLHFNTSISKIGVVICLLCILNTLYILTKNEDYIVSLVQNEEPKSLKVFDIINWILFISNMCCIVLNLIEA